MDLMGIMRLEDIQDAGGGLPSHSGGEVVVICHEMLLNLKSRIRYANTSDAEPGIRIFSLLYQINSVMASFLFGSWKLASGDGRVGGPGNDNNPAELWYSK